MGHNRSNSWSRALLRHKTRAVELIPAENFHSRLAFRIQRLQTDRQSSSPVSHQLRASASVRTGLSRGVPAAGTRLSSLGSACMYSNLRPCTRVHGSHLRLAHAGPRTDATFLVAYTDLLFSCQCHDPSRSLPQCGHPWSGSKPRMLVQQRGLRGVSVGLRNALPRARSGVGLNSC